MQQQRKEAGATAITHCAQVLTLPVGGVKRTSSPTSKGLLDKMIRPVNRFSKISLPARPTARPPTPPIANTLFTAGRTAVFEWTYRLP